MLIEEIENRSYFTVIEKYKGSVEFFKSLDVSDVVGVSILGGVICSTKTTQDRIIFETQKHPYNKYTMYKSTLKRSKSILKMFM